MKHILNAISELKFQVQNLENELILYIDSKQKHKEKDLSLQLVLSKVADIFQVSIMELQSKSRKKKLIQARATFTHFAELKGLYTKTDIGKAIMRDHTAVIFYKRLSFEERQEQYPEYQDQFKEAEHFFKNLQLFAIA